MERGSFVLHGLFPEDVATAWGDPLDPATPLFPEEEALVANAIPKRKREFAKGRECARVAMAKLGLRDVVLLSGSDREPLWPREITGSITHTNGLCAVAVGATDRYQGLGIDAEPAEALSPAIAARVLGGDDPRVLELGARSLEPPVVPRLVFSAKEAVYKCLFPITKTFLGFADVALELEKTTFRATLRVSAPPFSPGASLVGRWQKSGGFLVTALWLPRP
ncbi:MAG TPA: 4'-phosphopantetheinyl transferase superfamily protein [Polyangiaceae bacterium]